MFYFIRLWWRLTVKLFPLGMALSTWARRRQIHWVRRSPLYVYYSDIVRPTVKVVITCAVVSLVILLVIAFYNS